MKINLPFVSLAASALFFLGSAAQAQTLTQIGTGIAQGISADGDTVVGDGTGAWRWTSATGKVLITGTAALGVSGDGSTVFGSDGSSPTTGAVWTDITGWQSIGGLAGSSGCPDLSNPYNISDTGDVATGLGWDGCSAFAFRWTNAGGFQQLPQLGPHSSRGNDISGDGSHIGGWDEGNDGTRRAAIWFPNGTEQIILEHPTQNPSGGGEVWGFSTDGSYACGTGIGNLGAFRWTATTGPQYLGTIPGFQGATATAISDDGKTAVGFAGTAFSGLTAIIWTEAGGLQRFKTYAANELGITIPANLDFQILSDMTPDGRKVVSYVAQNAGPFGVKTAVVIELPAACGASTYGVGISPVNSISLQSTGNTNLGGTFVATSTGTSGSLCSTFVALDDSQFSTLGGFGLVNPAQIISVFTKTPIGGTSQVSIPIPSTPALANLDVYMQSLGDDALQPFGWALSNGLQLTICP